MRVPRRETQKDEEGGRWLFEWSFYPKKKVATMMSATKMIVFQKFTFKNLGIKPGEFLEYIHDPTIKVKVLNDDRLVEYEGKEYHLSNLAQQLLGRPSRVQGPLHFSYNGEVLTELRDRLENK